MKKAIVLVLCLGGILAFKVVLGQVMTLQERNVIEEVDYLYQLNNKYTHIPLTNFGDFEYTVHEYITPDNEIGYQIFYFYPDKVISIGSGVEFNSRTYTILYENEINNLSSTTVPAL